MEHTDGVPILTRQRWKSKTLVYCVHMACYVSFPCLPSVQGVQAAFSDVAERGDKGVH